MRMALIGLILSRRVREVIRGRGAEPFARAAGAVQAGAGVELHAKPGERVRAGEPLATLHTDTPHAFPAATAALAGAYEIGEQPPAPAPLVLDRIG